MDAKIISKNISGFSSGFEEIQITKTEEQKEDQFKIYRNNPFRKNGIPNGLEDCETWWDLVVLNFHGQLSSVDFIILR